ncbi:hypothetical protein IWW52_002639 [Coemansia sp. RSA 2704]|nr:hypothetical protein IWW54_002281 [Coemansia sp. RSA 2705]KAJ2318301.1 hypothetical protein IWW52_002639 [Coemansia sp. RSA 2704]
MDPAEYFDAFSSVDRNIRRLGKPRPLTHALHSPPSAPLPPRPLTTGRAERVFSRLPPGLDTIAHDGGDDEEATVAFLCSALPHYEGAAPIHYDDLDAPLPCASDDDDGDEEFVPDSAWSPPCRPPLQLPSPQTPRASVDAGVAAYEAWLDFDELLLAAQAAVDASGRLQCRLGRREETDYMLSYVIETVPDTGQCWAVQTPKPAIAPAVFAAEILALAYVHEHAQIPAPAVLAYSLAAANPVGAPYAVVDRMPGEPLAAHWPHLDARRKRRVLGHIADVVVQLARLEFPRIGSLAIADGALTVGPLHEPRQLEPPYAQLPDAPRYGPFDSARAYYQAAIQTSLDALDALEQTAGCPGSREPSLDRIELEAYAALADRFADARHDGRFALALESLDAHHFRIDPDSGQLTGVVDWTFCGPRPLATLVQPPAFTFDDTPRWEPVRLAHRLAHRRNLVRHRQWFLASFRKRAWALLGKHAADALAPLVRFGYWRFKFETEIRANIQYSNPWSFRAIWEHANSAQNDPDAHFAVWFAAAQAKLPKPPLQ